MKQVLLLCLLIPIASCGPNYKPLAATLATYQGKYQMTVRGKTSAIQVSLNGDDLYLTALWNGESNLLKPISPDNFIMQDKEWTVKFKRDKNGKVMQVLVMGTDLWTKINN